jgi:hypothetical protein
LVFTVPVDIDDEIRRGEPLGSLEQRGEARRVHDPVPVGDLNFEAG